MLYWRDYFWKALWLKNNLFDESTDTWKDTSAQVNISAQKVHKKIVKSSW